MRIENAVKKYNAAVDKVEELNNQYIIQGIHLRRFEKQKEIKEYLDYINNPTVAFYLDLVEFHKEITNRITQLKQHDKDSITINMLITKARSIKKAINKLKESEEVQGYLKSLKNFKVKLYLSQIKDIQKLRKQITIQENIADELMKQVRRKILVKKN